MERTEYSKQIQVGADEEGRGVFLTVELTRKGPDFTTAGEQISRQTITHDTVTDWLELSISGVVQAGSSGQIRAALDHLSILAIPEEQLQRIKEIWDRWHLNGLNAGCVHQPEEWNCPRCGTVNGWHLKPVYPKRGDGCTNCKLDRWDIGKPPFIGGWHVLRPDGSTLQVFTTEEEARRFLSEPRAAILSFEFRPEPNPCPEGYRYGTAWLVDPLPEEIAAEVKTWGADQGNRDPYQEQAAAFLREFGFEIRTAFKGDKAPPWDKTGVHGDRYRVTIKRTNPNVLQQESISFDFWNSQRDAAAGKRPSAYDILSSISTDAHAPTDPDEVVREFGDMKPSQAVAIAEFTKKLRAFFTKAEREVLAEIQ